MPVDSLQKQAGLAGAAFDAAEIQSLAPNPG
jgi:hypothetical protein